MGTIEADSTQGRIKLTTHFCLTLLMACLKVGVARKAINR